jgi:hypothetical protein
MFSGAREPIESPSAGSPVTSSARRTNEWYVSELTAVRMSAIESSLSSQSASSGAGSMRRLRSSQRIPRIMTMETLIVPRLGGLVRSVTVRDLTSHPLGERN